MVLDGNIGFTGAIMEKSISMIVDSQIFTVSGIFQFWIPAILFLAWLIHSYIKKKFPFSNIPRINRFSFFIHCLIYYLTLIPINLLYYYSITEHEILIIWTIGALLQTLTAIRLFNVTQRRIADIGLSPYFIFLILFLYPYQKVYWIVVINLFGWQSSKKEKYGKPITEKFIW